MWCLHQWGKWNIFPANTNSKKAKETGATILTLRMGIHWSVSVAAATATTTWCCLMKSQDTGRVRNTLQSKVDMMGVKLSSHQRQGRNIVHVVRIIEASTNLWTYTIQCLQQTVHLETIWGPIHPQNHQVVNQIHLALNFQLWMLKLL